MKPLISTVGILIAGMSSGGAFEPEKFSNEQFKVEYVEPATLPSLKKLPVFYPDRERALRVEAELLQKGSSAKVVDEFRRTEFRQAFFPIRVTDKVSGIVYEVQSDRQTVIAIKANGETLWKVTPFKDAKPYRVEHRFIIRFGKAHPAAEGKKVEFVSLTFNSSEFGKLELATGEFHYGGQD